ncbi:hypothetical protein N7510_006665 [Penicillium lagena]|uniref:uncharacterized protein n=1 Tax=Penicillium lagena TaxID=94218 RepID=UPI00253F8C80|nr:uncharacterized protein N7510_006665 [Penicillium lagena]KAJ5609946.1 hypothetical protein N7510_006665 [Penicillium lagena]
MLLRLRCCLWDVTKVKTVAGMTMSDHTGFSKPYFIVTWVELGISIIFLSVRCYTAFKILHRVGTDLYLALATFALGIGSTSMIAAGAANGLGVSEVYLTLEERRYALLFGWINQLLALLAIGLGKITIVLFLEQIQGYRTHLRTFTLWFLAGSNMVINLIVAVLALVQCEPPRRLWNEEIPGVCPGKKRVQIFGYIQGAWSAFCDFALALYPMLLFVRVRAFSIATRVGLCGLMGCGIVGLCNCQDYTAVILDEAGKRNKTEMWVVFIVSCIPPTKVFFKRAFTFALKKITNGSTLVPFDECSRGVAPDLSI